MYRLFSRFRFGLCCQAGRLAVATGGKTDRVAILPRNVARLELLTSVLSVATATGVETERVTDKMVIDCFNRISANHCARALDNVTSWT